MRHMGQKLRLGLAGLLRFLYGFMEFPVLFFKHLVRFFLHISYDIPKSEKQRQQNTAYRNYIPALVNIIQQPMADIRNIHILVDNVFFLRLRHKPQRFPHHAKQSRIRVF